MTDWSRLIEYVQWYFPDPKFSEKDVRKWAKDNVPAWNHISESDKDLIVGDWKAFVSPDTKSTWKRFVDKVKGWFKPKKWFGGN